MIETTNTENPSANGIASRCSDADRDEHQREQRHRLADQQERQAARRVARRGRSRPGARRCAPAARSPRRRAPRPRPRRSRRARPTARPPGTVSSAARIRLVRSIRASTAASGLPPVFWSSVANSRLYALHDAHDALDGGAESEEEPEVHDPVCVELAVEEVAAAAADHETESYLDSEGAGRYPPSATCFCCPGRWRGVRLTRQAPKIKRALRRCLGLSDQLVEDLAGGGGEGLHVLHRVRERQECRPRTGPAAA